MHPKRLEILNRLKWMLPVCAAICGIASVALWIIYMMKSNAPDNPLHSDGRWRWLGFAIVATLAEPILIISILHKMHLLKNGVEVEGWVKSIGSVTSGGRTPVTYEWEIEGKLYSMKRDTDNSDVKNYVEGSPVLLVADPKNPGRAYVFQN